MKIWVGVTDKNWYEHLIRLAPEEVNFWQPSGSRTFRVLQPGEPFLFNSLQGEEASSLAASISDLFERGDTTHQLSCSESDLTDIVSSD
jgi:hypothetical protein